MCFSVELCCVPYSGMIKGSLQNTTKSSRYGIIERLEIFVAVALSAFVRACRCLLLDSSETIGVMFSSYTVIF